MKILYVINNLGTGGAEKLLLDAIPKFSAKGIEVELLLLNGTKHAFLRELEKTNTCKIHDLGMGTVYNPLLVFKIIPYLKKFKIVHVHLFPALYWVGLAHIFSGAKAKLIYTEHSTSNRRRNFKYRFFDKIIYRQYFKIVCITDEVKQQLKSHLKLDASKFVTIENGIDLSKIENAPPSNDSLFESFEGNIKLLQVSRFCYPKDQQTVIRALPMLPENVVLLFVGDGETLEASKKLSRKLNVENRVQFLGIRTDVPQLLKRADIVILSSRYEGLSLSSIEGMASGKPLIASDVPGLRNLVKEAGILFPDQDEKALATAIRTLLDDKTYYSQVADKCVERANRYSIDKMVNSHIKLYKQLC